MEPGRADRRTDLHPARAHRPGGRRLPVPRRRTGHGRDRPRVRGRLHRGRTVPARVLPVRRRVPPVAQGVRRCRRKRIPSAAELGRQRHRAEDCRSARRVGPGLRLPGHPLRPDQEGRHAGPEVQAVLAVPERVRLRLPLHRTGGRAMSKYEFEWTEGQATAVQELLMAAADNAPEGRLFFNNVAQHIEEQKPVPLPTKFGAVIQSLDEATGGWVYVLTGASWRDGVDGDNTYLTPPVVRFRVLSEGVDL